MDSLFYALIKTVKCLCTTPRVVNNEWLLVYKIVGLLSIC